jgi:hypothetical protein
VWEVAVAAALGAIAAGDMQTAAELLRGFPALRPLAASLGWDLLATASTVTDGEASCGIEVSSGGWVRRNRGLGQLYESRKDLMAALWGAGAGADRGDGGGGAWDEVPSPPPAPPPAPAPAPPASCAVERLCRQLQYRLVGTQYHLSISLFWPYI